MLYRTGHLTKMFDVSRETIRAWSQEFSDYLSAGAKPETGKRRVFTADDVRVLALVSGLKNAGMVFADVHRALANGERGEIPSQDAVSLTAANQKQQMTMLQNRVSELEAKLASAQNDRMQLVGQVDLLRMQLKEAQTKIDNLNRQLGRLQPENGQE